MLKCITWHFFQPFLGSVAYCSYLTSSICVSSPSLSKYKHRGQLRLKIGLVQGQDQDQNQGLGYVWIRVDRISQTEFWNTQMIKFQSQVRSAGENDLKVLLNCIKMYSRFSGIDIYIFSIVKKRFFTLQKKFFG